ncbi:Pkinase-domain-containing protein, partial [Hanseniaspora valbyensis NRRL Y-1626]
ILLDDLVHLGKIGAGNSGTVMKVLHVPTQIVYAKKIISLPTTINKDKSSGVGMSLSNENQNKQIKLQIKRELEIMDRIGKQDENSNIIDFYSKNASIANEIVIIMEYMNLGSLDRILQTYKEHCRRCNVKISPATSWFNRNVIISRIAHDVLNGLAFLYDNFKIIHRDIKPSNILLNSKGRVKICDFGVSKNTVNSIVDTFVGTSTYMSPERIQGGIYTTKGDVWSLGLSIIELLTGKFPLDSREIKYDSDLDDADNSLRPDGILDLLQRIVNEPSPHLPTNYPFNEKLVDFVNKCCIKNPDERASIKELLQHEYIQKYNFNTDPKTQERYSKDFKKYCKELKKLLHDEKVIKRQKQQ